MNRAVGRGQWNPTRPIRRQATVPRTHAALPALSSSGARPGRLLKPHDLIDSPAHIVVKAADEFHTKTTAPSQFWQPDFTYLKVTGRGWFYLSTVLDDLSRYVIATATQQRLEAGRWMASDQTGMNRGGQLAAAAGWAARTTSSGGPAGTAGPWHGTPS